MLKVNQWQESWDEIPSFGKPNRRKPQKHFFVASIPVGVLKSISGVLKREAIPTEEKRVEMGIQRVHDPKRSNEIKLYREFGYPWSTMTGLKDREEFQSLKMPGWLPTAIIANIKTVEDSHPRRRVSLKDLCQVTSEEGDFHMLHLPESLTSLPWEPELSRPIEIIDGQHRLNAFSDDIYDENDEIPVVFFHGLDISWQAYLFYVINIKPKKINTSLAFDLYPMLREEDWLDRSESKLVYRETRAQEMVEAIWLYKNSVFYNRINMVGERNNDHLSQATFVRNILNTFLRTGDRNQPVRFGGFFGCLDKEQIGWSRVYQTSLLIILLNDFFLQTEQKKPEWLASLGLVDQLFSKTSLINSDQGLRGYLRVTNDLLIRCWDVHKLHEFMPRYEEGEPAPEALDIVIQDIKSYSPVMVFLQQLNSELLSFKWITSDNTDLSAEEKRARLAYKGSGGYKTLRQDLLDHLSSSNSRFLTEVDYLRTTK